MKPKRRENRKAAKKNKVYCFWGQAEEEEVIYIASEGFISARKEALCTDICDHMDSPFTDIRGKLCRREDKKPVYTEYSGVLNTPKLNELNLCENGRGKKKALEVNSQSKGQKNN